MLFTDYVEVMQIIIKLAFEACIIVEKDNIYNMDYNNNISNLLYIVGTICISILFIGITVYS